MRKLIFVSLAVALLAPVRVHGQDSAKPDAVTRADLKTARASSKVVTLYGKVGEDGQTLATRKNNLWAIANPEILRDHAGKQVKIKCQMSADSDTNTIRVVSVKSIQTDLKYSANKDDAAFRR